MRLYPSLLIVCAVIGDAALSDSNPAELKRAYAALTAAVLEATRVDLDEAGFV